MAMTRLAAEQKLRGQTAAAARYYRVFPEGKPLTLHAAGTIISEQTGAAVDMRALHAIMESLVGAGLMRRTSRGKEEFERLPYREEKEQTAEPYIQVETRKPVPSVDIDSSVQDTVVAQIPQQSTLSPDPVIPTGSLDELLTMANHLRELADDIASLHGRLTAEKAVLDAKVARANNLRAAIMEMRLDDLGSHSRSW